MLAKKSSVSRRKPCAQRVVEVREDALHGDDGVEVAQVQPLAGEVLDERRRRADRRACAAPAARARSRVAQRAALGRREQLVVGDAAPEEERQPRRELEVADAVRRSPARRRPDPARRGTGTPGDTSKRFSASWMPASKPCVGAVAVEREQRRDVGVGRRAADTRGARACARSRLRRLRLPLPRRRPADGT